jgi:hypothetical protein
MDTIKHEEVGVPKETRGEQLHRIEEVATNEQRLRKYKCLWIIMPQYIAQN